MVSPPAKVFSMLIFTEDGGPNGKNAFATIEGLTKELLTHIDSRCKPRRIDFQPATDEAREILVSNGYINTKDRRRRYRLYQVIAAQLKADDGFVVHHFDADRTWRERDRKAPLDAKPVQKHILDHVRILLQQNGVGDAEIDTMLKRYLRLVPYREIEAWLYQNTGRVATYVCRRKDCGCLTRLAEWRADRGLLDEVPDPPAALRCVGKRHNPALIEDFPTGEVYAAEKSLAASIDAMRNCGALRDALARTHHLIAPEGPSA